MAAIIFVAAVNFFMAAGLCFWVLYLIVVAPTLSSLPELKTGPANRGLWSRWPDSQLERYRLSLAPAQLRAPHNWYLLHARAFILIGALVALAAGVAMSLER